MLNNTRKQINNSKNKINLTIYTYGSKIELKFNTFELPCKLKQSLEELGFENQLIRTPNLQIYYLNLPGVKYTEIQQVVKNLIDDLGDQFNINLL